MDGRLSRTAFATRTSRRLRQPGALYVAASEASCCTPADDLADGKAVGWFQGRMEFGPRALGTARSSPTRRSRDMQSALNLKVKYRESFRPFAPAVLRRTPPNFDLDADSPYMLLVADVVEAPAARA